jgi:hypothetical protein
MRNENPVSQKQPADPLAMPVDWVHPMTPDAARKYRLQVAAYGSLNCRVPQIYRPAKP